MIKNNTPWKKKEKNKDERRMHKEKNGKKKEKEKDERRMHKKLM